MAAGPHTKYFCFSLQRAVRFCLHCDRRGKRAAHLQIFEQANNIEASNQIRKKEESMISCTLPPRRSQFSSPMFWLVKTSRRPLCLNIADHHPIPGNRMCLRATKGKRKHTINTIHTIQKEKGNTLHWNCFFQVKIIIPAHTG